jgi:uncharacterized protein YndB with AHSA1/START domain
MMETTMTDPAIRRSTHVEAPVEHAFEVFTRRMHAWWPLSTHSIRAGREGLAPAELHLELRAGGRFYEQTGDEQASWGSVLAYEPPHRIVLEWHVNPANPATEVEVTFAAEGDGTRVELVHRGWERFAGAETRGNYASENGWSAVLARYADAAAVTG